MRHEPAKLIPIPQLVDTHEAARILGRSAATLKRWRCEGIGPNFILIEGRVSYSVEVLLDYIRKNTRVIIRVGERGDSRESF